MTPPLSELEEAAFSSWPAAEVEVLGGWRLRAADGFTGRANSVHVGDDIDPPDLDRRLARVVEFYSARDTTPRIQVPLPHERLLAGLRSRGWTTGHGADVLVGPVQPGASGGVEVLDHPEEMLDVWWLVNEAAGTHRVASAYLLRRITPPVGFAVARDAARAVACGVGTVRDDLLGLAAMATVPEARGRGHARRVIAGLGEWAEAHGAAWTWLQVEPENAPAVGLYESLGMRRAYSYVYLEHRG